MTVKYYSPHSPYIRARSFIRIHRDIAQCSFASTTSADLAPNSFRMKSVVALLVCVLVAGAMAGDLLAGPFGGVGVGVGVYGKGVYGGYGAYPYAGKGVFGAYGAYPYAGKGVVGAYGAYPYAGYGYPYGGVYGKGYGYGVGFPGYGYGY